MKKLSVKTLGMRTVIFAALVAGMIAILVPGFRAVRHEHQVKILLLKIQHALQDWHVAEETYPRQPSMNGAEIVKLLIDSGHLEETPYNPWTGRLFSFESETESSDRIRYSTDELAETYALKALNRNDDGVFLQIDSTEHQSLE